MTNRKTSCNTKFNVKKAKADRKVAEEKLLHAKIMVRAAIYEQNGMDPVTAVQTANKWVKRGLKIS